MDINYLQSVVIRHGRHRGLDFYPASLLHFSVYIQGMNEAGQRPSPFDQSDSPIAQLVRAPH